MKILIGGSKHGEVCAAGHEQVVWKAAVPRATDFTFRPYYDFLSDFEASKIETYVEKNFGLTGTQRRLKYLVLETLSEDQAIELIGQYETEDEAPPLSEYRCA